MQREMNPLAKLIGYFLPLALALALALAGLLLTKEQKHR
jgi:UPF0716 family protein affecting phage T7 exclusion